MRLNAELIRRRRRELAMSHRQLARSLSVTSIVVSGLEAGSNHETLTLGFVGKLAEVLAIAPHTLIESDRADDPTAPGDLVAAVGSLLASISTLTPVSVLVEALDASLADVEAALEVLDAGLAGVGLTVHRLKGEVMLRPNAQLDPDSLKVMLRRHQARRGLNLTEARVLARVLAGSLDEGKLGNADMVALNRLRNAGLVTETDVVLTRDVQLTFSAAVDSTQ